ncbi:high-potential iron-sulfur protein [Bacteroidota bacterium]
MSKKEVTRRSFLAQASALGLVAFGSSAVLTACGGGESQPADQVPAPAPEPMASGCNDLSGLSDAEVQMRSTLAYVDESSIPDKNCNGCQLFVPAEGGAACGGCQIIKGPIAAGGYCTSWAAKVS